MRTTFLWLAGAAVLASSPAALAADPARGRTLFELCAPCHSTQAGKHGMGPSLAGVIGRTAGTLEGFRYSGPMRRSKLTWTEAELDRYLENPQQLVPGNRMPYSGMPSADDRAALIRYLAGFP